ncbi:MAG: hypothetical protein HOC72_18865, partial [Rhodospirillaceae bacterium]|nr:hypothetical protein [Rhodospirillaceae bacterium]
GILLFILWCIGLWASPFYIAPTSDDGAYISEAIGVMNFGLVSMFYIDHPALYSAAFPSYPFLSGLFFTVWDAVGLPINFFVYNAFHNLTMTFVLLGIIYLLFRTAESRREGSLRVNIGLSLLAISPYIIDAAHLRPEPLGLAATIGAIIAFRRADLARGSGRGGYALAALLLGLAITMHPSLTVTAGLTAFAALVILLRRGMIGTSILAIIAGLIAPAVVIGWYLANLPESTAMLFFEVNQRSSTLSGLGASFKGILDYILFASTANASVAVKLFNAVLFAVLSLSIVLALVMFWTVYRNRRVKLEVAEVLCGAFFFGALFNTLIDPSGRTQLYVVLSCASVLMLAMLVRWPSAERYVPEQGHNAVSTVLPGIVAAAMILAVLFNPIAHISKRLVFPTLRYHGLTANALVRPYLQKGDALFFTTDQFLPPFVDLVADTYSGNADIDAFWIFPYMHGRPDLEHRAVNALVCFLARRQGERIVWGLRKDFVALDPSDPKRVTIRIVDRFRAFRVEFEMAENLYEFHDGYFLAGRVLTFSEVFDNTSKATNALLFRAPDHAPGCSDPAPAKIGGG